MAAFFTTGLPFKICPPSWTRRVTVKSFLAFKAHITAQS